MTIFWHGFGEYLYPLCCYLWFGGEIMTKTDTWCTDKPVCPYCGHIHRDNSEMHEVGQYTCDECNRDFELMVEWNPTYYTGKIEEDD